MLLGVLFVGVAVLFRDQALGVSEDSLRTSLTQTLSDWKGPPSTPDLGEAHESFPDITFSYFGSGTAPLATVGPLRPRLTDHFQVVSSGGHVFLTDGQKSQGCTLCATLDWTEKGGELTKLDQVLFLLWILVELIVGAVSWYTAKATFKPLQELTQQAATESGVNLSARLHSKDSAEFGSFAIQLNFLLDRIEETTKRQEQFAADAAHELRTPLTTLLARLETSLMNPRSEEEYRALVASLVPEVERLSRLVELLLRSTRSDLEPAPLVELKPLVELAVARWRDRFEERGVHLVASLASAQAGIRPEELQSVLDNLLENALRYSPLESTVSISLAPSDGTACITVSDQGPGVPPELLPSIFDRLTTGETSRTKASGGFGIGLAICKSIVVARGGNISAENRDPGAAFTVVLPT